MKYPQLSKISDLIEKNNVSKKAILLVLDWDLNKLETNLEYTLKSQELNKIYLINELINKKQDYTFSLGYKYFYNIKLNIKQKVFVPQNDTELLIDEVINISKTKTLKNGFEVGIGSGAISLALVKNISELQMVGIDNNYLAINLSNQNANLNKLKSKVKFELSDLFFLSIDQKFDFIISNPPYIDLEDVNVSKWVLENQPFEALFSLNNGLKHIEEILKLGSLILNPNGFIIFEFGFEQKNIIDILLSKYTYKYEFKKDFNNNWRYIILWLPF